MVLPLIMMAGTAATTALGAKAANDANQTNADISMLNYYEQQRANRASENEARRQQAESKLGTTDAAGNRTYFVPGRGWVTELAADQQELQDLTEAEQKRVLTDEAGRNAEISERARDRRGREDTLATEADRDFRSQRRDDPEGLRQLMLARGAETRNDAADRAGELSARAATRTGGHSAADIRQGTRAEADADSARQAGVQAMLAARGMADQNFAQGRDDSRNVLDYFRRMSTTGAQPVRGVNPTGPQTRSTAGADQSLAIALSKAPQLDYQSPNTAYTDGAQGLLNMFGSYHGMQQTDKDIGRVRGNQGSWQGIVN